MSDSSTGDPAERLISAAERSGVLDPKNLGRYAATWIAPSPELADVVDRFWHVTWGLNEGENLDQRIIDLPAVTLTIEEGNVPDRLVVTGPQQNAWRRNISGRGRVFGIRLRPAGLAVVSDLEVSAVNDSTVPLTPALDARLHGFMVRIAAEHSHADRARVATELFTAQLRERPVPQRHLIANAVLDELRARVHERAGSSLARQFNTSERTLQRALLETVGHGPKWISRRIRLQEVAVLLASRPDESLATFATELGYTDQSHLTTDFRAIAGVTPASYRRQVAALLGG